MSKKHHIESIKSFFKLENVGEIQFDLAEKIDNIKHTLLPNELAYVADNTSLEIELIGDRKHSLEILGLELKNVSDLYEHVHKGFIDHVVHFAKNIGKTAILDKNASMDDMTVSLYKTYDGKILYKRTAALNIDASGAVTHTLGILSDLSAFAFDIKNFQVNFHGPNSNIYFSNYHDAKEMVNILGRREIEILALIKEGYSTKQIAGHLFISPHTVRTHRNNIRQKLQVSSSIAAINKGIELGLL